VQDRYAGDVGDYIKLALLRRLARDRRVALLWWKHPDEGYNADGKHTTYLDSPAWRGLDGELFEQLLSVRDARPRSIARLEGLKLFPAASYSSELVPHGPSRQAERQIWFQQQLELAETAEVVFVDPDNGIDLRADAERRASPKHVSLDELRRLAGRGRPLIVYHHQTRRTGGHHAEISWICSEFKNAGMNDVSAIRARSFSPRVFFLVNMSDAMRKAAMTLVSGNPDKLEWFQSEPERKEAPNGWAATVLTLYPEMFPGPLGTSLAGRALREGRWSMETVQIRDFATDRHRSVDDTPAGGGAGMVMRADVLAAALDSVAPGGPVLAMTPRGKTLSQARVRELAGGPGVTILCGRFEGIDERLLEAREIEQVSIGDYILSGGEMAALTLLDACIRLLPGVMGAPSSGMDESFETGLLEYPQYTRPAEWEGRTIPEVLRSGDHARINAWRKLQAETDTRLRRPDLWERHEGARVSSPSGARQKKEE
jgi:tRNA (guanine37-N1)-methyltransferase